MIEKCDEIRFFQVLSGYEKHRVYVWWHQDVTEQLKTIFELLTARKRLHKTALIRHR